MKCNISKKCGGCQFQGIPYKEQLKKKQKKEQSLLGAYGKVCPIIGMENPYYYRNKVHAVFDRDRKENIISGIFIAMLFIGDHVICLEIGAVYVAM